MYNNLRSVCVQDKEKPPRTSYPHMYVHIRGSATAVCKVLRRTPERGLAAPPCLFSPHSGHAHAHSCCLSLPFAVEARAETLSTGGGSIQRRSSTSASCQGREDPWSLQVYQSGTSTVFWGVGGRNERNERVPSDSPRGRVVRGGKK